MSNDPIAQDAPQASQDRAEEQGGADWPDPGQEGYVHADGTPQSEKQLADNKQAAADRAAAGSIIHGAPLGVPGEDPGAETAKAADRAAEGDDVVPAPGGSVKVVSGKHDAEGDTSK